MPADLSANWPLILIGLALLVLAAWLITRANRKARVVTDDSATPLARDVLAEGAAPAPRNQALIDAAPAVVTTIPDPVAAEPAPVVAAAPAPAAAAADDLSRIKGVGPKLVALLGELGVISYAQIAAWSDADIQRIDARLGRFAGRITRDQWVEQAKLLAAGDEAGFTGRFGNNG
jgi:predicted flap endonuclease-1-like 5' DNA nuclease